MSKLKSSSKELTAALSGAGIALENLRGLISSAALKVSQVTTQPDGERCTCSPWVRDIVAPVHEIGETWCAIVQGADGKTYELDFTIEAGAVKLAGEPREVVATVEYSPAPAAVEAQAAGRAAAGELQADSQAGSAQPRKDNGKFHGADAASSEADAASSTAKTKAEHQAAAGLHHTAMKLHAAAGHADTAEAHRIKAKKHEDCANELNAAKSPTGKNVRAPLEAAFAVAAPDKFDAFMVMPAGIHTVTLGRMGRPHTVTVDINPAGARARQAQLEAVNRACKLKAFNCFDHERKKASSHPQRYWWEDGSTPGRPAGIYESAEPTKSGLEAVTGKDYQGWSETFWVDNDFAGPANPAQLINPLDADDAGDPDNYRVMGTLTNKPAFTDNEPLFAAKPISPPASATAARKAGAQVPSSTTNKTNNMEKQPLDAAALQSRIEQLEQEIAGLEAKDDAVSKAELRASKSELDARQAELKLAKQNERLEAMEARETKRKELEAERAVQAGVQAMAIPALDKKAQGEWKEKFVKDPTLIPLMAATWEANRPSRGRISPNANSAEIAALGYGAVQPGVYAILKSMHSLVKKQLPIRGLDASSNQRRTLIARDLAIIYRNECRGKALEADGNGGYRPSMNMDFVLAPLEATNMGLDAASDADTLGTLAGTLVSQRYLDIFMYKLPLISNGKIMTDFSDQPSELKQTVSTRKIVVPGVVSYDPTLQADGYPNGWVPASAPQTVDVNITMDELIGVPIQYDLATLSETQRQLFMEMAPAAAYANAKYFVAKLFKVCTAANFNAYAAVTAPDAQGVVKVPVAYPTYTCALIDFARSKMADVAAAFDANEVPDEDRSVILNSLYYNKATTDPSLVTFFAGQQSPEIVTDGKLPDLAGFSIIKGQNFPATNNAFGIFLQKNGLLAKSRLPQNLNTIIPGAGNGAITQIVHPESGLAMMLIQFVDHRRGFSAWLPCAILGAAPGDTRGGIVGTTQ